MIGGILALGAASFVLSWALTRLMISAAPRLGMVDRPGGRKIHDAPKPLGGGVAIILAFVLPLLAVVIGVRFVEFDGGTPQGALLAAYAGGVMHQTPLAVGMVVALVLMHILGLWDDRRALGPYVKLVVQLSIIAGLVLCFDDLRAVAALDQLGLGAWPSIVVTVLWIGAVTNSFNFLDNMDGLSSGVAAVSTTAFLITTLSIEQWFVAAALALLLGALLGFLCWNFPPARIFMGDSGSLVIGLALGILTVRTTFLPEGVAWGAGWYSIFAPLIVLALPLYDLVVVSIIRMSRGRSPFVGDTNHFSHRLVARGMSRRTAVLCLYLITAATASAAIVLPHVRTTFAAMLIFGQTMLVLGMVALLEQHPLPRHNQP